jgi:putative ABC transport system substrate-binding protein
VKRARILFNPDTAPYSGTFVQAILAAGRALSVEIASAPVHSKAEIEKAIASLANEPNGGLIVIPDTFVLQNREQIIALVEKHRLPAVYSTLDYARAGGMLVYGVDTRDLFRRAAVYVDRILKGAKPADLPVQQPVKFALIVNLKVAKALSFSVPPSFLLRADEVIE